MPAHKVVSRDQWLAARKALLAREKELTRARDRIAEERRALPWVEVDKGYVFDSTAGKRSLASLFGERSQLAVYHFMLTPGSDHVCTGCAFIADHIDAARQHFENADLSFAAISRAPVSQIEPVRKRMGWKFTWVSSNGNDFNYDYGVSFTPEQVASGEMAYNFGTSSNLHSDLPGISMFFKDPAGAVFHTYSSYARGGGILIGAYNWLDMAPKGRNETEIMDWVRLHDEYGPARASCCHAEASS